MKISMKHKKSKKNIDLIASPINLEKSPVEYKKSPPVLGEDTNKILKKFLKLEINEIKKLRKEKII